MFFTGALLVGGGEMVVGRIHGDREGGAPLVVLALVLVGVVTLDAVGRGVVAVSSRMTGSGVIPEHWPSSSALLSPHPPRGSARRSASRVASFRQRTSPKAGPALLFVRARPHTCQPLGAQTISEDGLLDAHQRVDESYSG